MIFPFELDDFWASKLIFRSVSGLFNKDFHQSEISSYWIGPVSSFTLQVLEEPTLLAAMSIVWSQQRQARH